jgi:hypothetical protein
LTDRSFERANAESRARLARLAATLTPAQLATDLGEGWIVASALAHVGFWDRWQAARWNEMLAGKWSADDDSVIASERLANEALHPYWASVEGESLASMAVEAAATLDALVAQAPDALVEKLEGGPSGYLLHRHRHRDDHIDHIRRVLAGTHDTDQRPDRSYVQRNAATAARMRELAVRLTPEELALPVGGDGRTVAMLLGHVGFWDRWMAARWLAAVAAGGRMTGIPEGLVDSVNEAVGSILAAFASTAANDVAAEAAEAAQAVDRLIADLPREAHVAVVLRRAPRAVDRSVHRSEHIAEIEQALAARRT